ncbi:MAG: hypothetical protein FWE67_02485 [Planctomycetaceae bacterium]|nr:hypothetical protein [Planctomycetaceae bacterium]
MTTIIDLLKDIRCGLPQTIFILSFFNIKTKDLFDIGYARGSIYRGINELDGKIVADEFVSPARQILASETKFSPARQILASETKCLGDETMHNVNVNRTLTNVTNSEIENEALRKRIAELEAQVRFLLEERKAGPHQVITTLPVSPPAGQETLARPASRIETVNYTPAPQKGKKQAAGKPGNGESKILYDTEKTIVSVLDNISKEDESEYHRLIHQIETDINKAMRKIRQNPDTILIKSISPSILLEIAGFFVNHIRKRKEFALEEDHLFGLVEDTVNQYVKSAASKKVLGSFLRWTFAKEFPEYAWCLTTSYDAEWKDEERDARRDKRPSRKWGFIPESRTSVQKNDNAEPPLFAGKKQSAAANDSGGKSDTAEPLPVDSACSCPPEEAAVGNETQERMFAELETLLGSERFSVWFKSSAVAVKGDNGNKTLVFTVRNRFAADWIKGNFANELAEAIRRLTNRKSLSRLRNWCCAQTHYS